MIQLKQLLCEQLGGRNAVFKQAGADRNGVVSPFNAKKIAKLIYDSKSFFNDDEVLVKNVIVKNIKNIKQYGDVNIELQKLTSGRGIGMYLRSFLNNVDRLEIIKSLITVIPEDHWNWTILNIMPFTDFKVLSKSNSSLWDKLAGNVTSGVPISNTETKLMKLYYPEKRRQQKDTKRFWAEEIMLDTIVNTLVPLSRQIKKLPVHLRCFYEFLVGRTSTFTEADLHGDERTFLLNACLSHGLNNGFKYDYWKSIGATGALSLTKGGAAAETKKYGIMGTLINMISPNMPTAFMYTLGETSKNNIYKYGPNTIVVQDHYDFNSREYKMTNEQIIKEFTDSINNFQKGESTPYHIIRKAANLRELGGYYGFRVNFILRYTAAPKSTSYTDVTYTKDNPPYTDLLRNPIPKLIASVIKQSKGVFNDYEAWAEAAFMAIKTKSKYELVKKELKKDPYEYVKSFVNTSKRYHKQPIDISYKSLLEN